MNNTRFLNADGSPNMAVIRNLSTTSDAIRDLPGALDDIRFCRWDGQSSDGRKHDIPGDPSGAAFPWDMAADTRAFVADGIISKQTIVRLAALRRALASQSSGSTGPRAWAGALVDWIMNESCADILYDEAEMSSSYMSHYGWCAVSPRWERSIELRRAVISMATINMTSSQAAPGTDAAMLPVLILDPSQELAAIEYFRAFYQDYLTSQLPSDLRDKAPKIKDATIRAALRDLREKGEATVVIPYLCHDRPRFSTLKPYEDVMLPAYATGANDFIIQIERIPAPELQGRVSSEGYDAAWVEEVIKHAGESAHATSYARSSYGPYGTRSFDSSQDRVCEIWHAIYRDRDADGVLGTWMTTYHPSVNSRDGKGDYGRHDFVESIGGKLPFVIGTQERWCRQITAQRPVTELAATQQDTIKNLIDSVRDRTSLTVIPPVNLYKTASGQPYRFAPAAQNYIQRGAEPTFMGGPPTQGLNDALTTLQITRKDLDEYFGAIAETNPPLLVQLTNEHMAWRFLNLWTQVMHMLLELCQRNMKDADFAEITGAPAGWLDAHREDTPLRCHLSFDVMELDPEMMLKRIEAMNSIVLPQDVMGTISRTNWARLMVRAVNPAWEKELVMPAQDANAQAMDRARREISLMFVGNPMTPLDKDDPTAKSMMDYSRQVISGNPRYLMALTDDALMAVFGPQAQVMAQQLGQRNPDPLFSANVVKWFEHLKFIGTTQPANAQIGKIGVDPESETETPQPTQ